MKLRHLIFSCTVISAGTSFGAVILGSDSANDTAYNISWSNGTDGGTAGTFGAWSLTGSGDAGRFIGDSTTLAPSNTGANINTVGESFGMFAHTGQTSEAFRDFNGNTLGVGQTFSLNLAVNFRNGNKGFDLRNSSDAVIFNFNVGSDDYFVNNAATAGSIGNTYSSNTSFALSFTQTSLSGGTWSIVRSGGVSDTDSGTYTGVAENFKFYNSQTLGGGLAENNLYFNSLTVVPEPSAVLLGGLGALMFLRRRRF